MSGLRSEPKKSRVPPGVWNPYFWFTLLGFGVLLYTSVRWYAALSHLKRLRREGVPATAFVDEAVPHASGGRDPVIRLAVTYHFQPPGGPPVEGWQTIALRQQGELEADLAKKQIEILYLPSDPSVHHVALTVEHDADQARLRLWVYGVLTLLTGAVCAAVARMTRQEFERWWWRR